MLKDPRVVVTRQLPERIEARMKELFHAELRDPDGPMSKSELLAAVVKADVLVPTVTDRIDAEVLEHAGDQLKLVANLVSV